MIQLILGSIGLALWGLYVIFTYYSKSYSGIDHIESTTNYGGYLFSVICLYGIYKFLSIQYGGKKVTFSFLGIIGAFFGHLLVLSFFYTQFPEVQNSPFLKDLSLSSLTLFFHSIGLLVYPIVLVFLSFGTGSYILGKMMKDWDNTLYRAQFPINITLGLFLFSTGLLVLGVLSMYSLGGLLVILGLMSVPTILNYKKYPIFLEKMRGEFDQHSSNGSLIEMIQPRLLSVETAFFFVSFLISVSLINAIRPMPIGWDDLGVYMNFPKLMALSGQYLHGAGLYSWQLITGTGFFFDHTAAQAFYINQLGGILVVIFLTCAFSLLLSHEKGVKILSLPLILATIFYAMPMNIFQQAKDMKLDPALLSISISAIIGIFFLWKKELSDKREQLTLLGIIGIILGFAFTIKVTTLMLIIGILGLIAYRILGIRGFIGYFLVFIGVFTIANFWKMMNVILPDGYRSTLFTIGLIFLIIGILLLFGFQNKKSIFDYTKSSIVIILGVCIGVSPWLIKNYSEAKSTKISFILNGSGGNLNPDFNKIYSNDELQKRLNSETDWLTNSGISQNEDMGRYFGYETGLNNYLKLPANLTFQKNQAGEFTDITFIYLAFLPILLLFIPSRKNIFAISVGVLTLCMGLYFFTDGLGGSLSKLLSLINLPFGYIVLLAISIGTTLGIHFCLDDTHRNTGLKELFIVLGIYGFLFVISAFGIVWYGIVIYFLFLGIIALTSQYFVTYDPHTEDEESIGLKITTATIFAIFILVYFVRSAFPHGWNNLKEASYNEFKYKILNQEESIFTYRQDYILPIATMNLKDPKGVVNSIVLGAKSPLLQEFQKSEVYTSLSVRDIISYLMYQGMNPNQEVAKDAKILSQKIFDAILYPTQENKNSAGIYRIGTFMTYLISENRKRYFDDSLVFAFDQLFYDADANVTIDRMRKIGLKYLLVDLNAATIDRDPRRNLTNRFERLLHTMKSKNLKLVDTDNLCLQFALDEYKAGRLQDPNAFIDVAGTNYESYRQVNGSPVTLSRHQKLNNCYNTILATLYTGNAQSGATIPSYLAPIKKAIDSQNALGGDQESQKKLANIMNTYAGQSWFALFEIQEDIPVIPSPSTNVSGEVNLQ